MSPPQVIHKRSPPLLHMGCVKIFSNKTAVLTAVFEYEMYSPIPSWSNMAYMSALLSLLSSAILGSSGLLTALCRNLRVTFHGGEAAGAGPQLSASARAGQSTDIGRAMLVISSELSIFYKNITSYVLYSSQSPCPPFLISIKLSMFCKEQVEWFIYFI